MVTLDVELDGGAVQPADLVTGWVRVSGEVDAALVGLFGRDVDGGVYGDTFVVRFEGGRARFVVPVPFDAAPARAEDALCLLLCRIGTAEGEIAAEQVTPVTVEAPSTAREAALRQYAGALTDLAEQPERALVALEAAAASLPGYAPVHALLGDLLYASRRDETGARKAWGAARRASPLALDEGFANWRLALHVAASGNAADLARAQALLEAALAAAPRNSDYREALAAVHARTGALALAEVELLRALEERDTPNPLRGLMNLYEQAGRDDDLLALGERLYQALANARGEAAAGGLRQHCEYFYVLARAASRRGFKGAARRWVARYFDHFDPGDRAAGSFAGSPFAQHGQEAWFLEAAAAVQHRPDDDPYWQHLQAQQAKTAPSSDAGAAGTSEADRAVAAGTSEADRGGTPASSDAHAAAAGTTRPAMPAGFKVLPSGLILGPRFFEPRDAAALRARWGTGAPDAPAPATPPITNDGPLPALSRRGSEHWDSPIFDPAFRKKEES